MHYFQLHTGEWGVHLPVAKPDVAIVIAKMARRDRLILLNMAIPLNTDSVELLRGTISMSLVVPVGSEPSVDLQHEYFVMNSGTAFRTREFGKFRRDPRKKVVVSNIPCLA